MFARTLWLLQVLLISYAAISDATSTFRNSLRAISSVENSRIHGSNTITAFSTFQLSFQTFKRNIRLHLRPNHDILQPDSQVHFFDNNGQIVHSEAIDRLDHKVFMGDVWAQNLDKSFSQVGHARILVHRDGPDPVFEGAFDIEHDYYHIQLYANYLQTKNLDDPTPKDTLADSMVVFRDSDLVLGALYKDDLEKRNWHAHDTVTPSCMTDPDPLAWDAETQDNMNLQDLSSQFSSQSLFSKFPFSLAKRQLDSTPNGGNSAGVNLASSIGNSYGCPSTRRVALVGVATDCGYSSAFADDTAVRNNVINVVNTASAIYELTFNISLGLQNLVVSPRDCPTSPAPATPWNQACSSSLQINDRLNLFSNWRAQQVDTNSHWTLLSTCPTGTAVGLAWLGQACVINADATNSSGSSNIVSGANVVVRTSGGSTEWQVLAHETGHTFGAVHDCTSTTCSDGTVTRQQCCPLSSSSCDAGEQFIMNPFTATGISRFSQCSLGNICSAFGRQSVKTTCFSNNRGVPLITGAVCGNGIVEQGEQCDCGGTDNCRDDSCCDPSTCTFRGDAVCDPVNEDCCIGCQFSPAGTVCRPSTGACDPAETCTGLNSTCPIDVNTPNGQSCGSGLTCASGQCTSRDKQCQNLMGPYLTGGNDTVACDDESCVLSCSSSHFGPGLCYGLKQNLLDGTPCGGGGQCANGICTGSTFGSEIRNWINRNRGLFIAICVVGGVLVIAALFCMLRCLFQCCSRSRRPKTVAPPPYQRPTSQWQPHPSQWQPQPVMYNRSHRDPNEWRYG